MGAGKRRGSAPVHSRESQQFHSLRARSLQQPGTGGGGGAGGEDIVHQQHGLSGNLAGPGKSEGPQRILASGRAGKTRLYSRRFGSPKRLHHGNRQRH